MACDFSVAFNEMWMTTPDVVAWICSPDTVIDYPVMHGESNDTYLHSNWRRVYSTSGSIFADYKCTGDLVSDFNTMIYGHNMKNGSMFHSIKNYASQSYYEEHPYIWYVTPEANYLLYLVAGYVVESDDEAYYLRFSVEGVQSLLENAVSRSDFEADYVIAGLDADKVIETAQRVVVLSTCSYEFDDARYILVAVPLLAD